MATETTTPPPREFDTLQEAFNAAAEAAMTSFGRPVSGILYTQGGRRFISTGLPIKMLLSLARRQSASKKEDPATTRNRPLDQGHVRDIAEYLRNASEYLIPPIILNAAQPLQTFVYRGSAATRPCVFVLPPEDYLYVTDGQHRLEALRQAMTQRPELEHDAVGVTIIEEADIDKVHQGFFDAAQVKPLAKALLVEYDGREPVNWLTREVSNAAHVFKGRIERIGNVGKNSLMLFTTNQIKQSVLQLVVSDCSLYGEAMQKQAVQAVGPANDLWKERLINFFNEFTEVKGQLSAADCGLWVRSRLRVPHVEVCVMIFSIGSIPERKWHEREGGVRTVALCTPCEGRTCGKEEVKMAKGFTISRVGHIGIQVTNVDRSITWYRDILGLTVTGRWPMGENGEMAFMRFSDDHHNVVLFTHPTRVTDENRNAGYNALQHIALEVADRDEWLKALADLKRKGVEIVQGPLIHGPEGGPGAGRNFGGSGSRSFYFLDPDGNRLEIYTDMMKVPEGEQFPRAEYAEVFKK